MRFVANGKIVNVNGDGEIIDSNIYGACYYCEVDWCGSSGYKNAISRRYYVMNNYFCSKCKVEVI